MAMREKGLDGRAFVLVIEDDAMIRMLTAEYIEDAGSEVLEAANADDAVRILESPDDVRTIFTDINMPGSMDGLMLTHAIRDRWSTIQIIVTSGRTQLDERQLPVGTRFFVKPYNPEHLVEALRDLPA